MLVINSRKAVSFKPYCRVRANASASDSIASAIIMLPASFATLACFGSVPRGQVFFPSASNSGCAFLRAPGSPAVMMFSSPLAATDGIPNTGAVAKGTFAFSCACCNSSTSSGEIVAMMMCTQSRLADSRAPESTMTARTASSLASMVRTTSLRKASLGFCNP